MGGKNDLLVDGDISRAWPVEFGPCCVKVIRVSDLTCVKETANIITTVLCIFSYLYIIYKVNIINSINKI
jgi:hypothetical protein